MRYEQIHKDGVYFAKIPDGASIRVKVLSDPIAVNEGKQPRRSFKVETLEPGIHISQGTTLQLTTNRFDRLATPVEAKAARRSVAEKRLLRVSCAFVVEVEDLPVLLDVLDEFSPSPITVEMENGTDEKNMG